MLALYTKLKQYRKYLLFFIDFILWNMSYYFSFALIRRSYSLKGFEDTFIASVFILNISFILISFLFRVYDRIWRYAEIEEFFYAGIYVFCGNIVFFIISSLLHIHIGMRTYIMNMLMTVCFIVAIRGLYRIYKILEKRNGATEGKKRVLIVGGGSACTIILNEIYQDDRSKFMPICIVDDDNEKIGRKVRGVKVQGSTYDVPELVRKYNIDLILFSINVIDRKQKRRILDICAKCNIPVKIIPSISRLVSKKSVSPVNNFTSQMRTVEVEDLLGRDPIIFDRNKHGEYIKDKVVLVTGGGGSIGSEICRQVAKLNPKHLIILDFYENGVYNVQQELIRNHKEELSFEVEIANVQDVNKLRIIFQQNDIDVVFHAAAHKHVPLMEKDPEEAVKNNVFGTLNLVKLADEYSVSKFVQISTDKAVNPTNVMGATKRICEMIIQMMNEKSKTDFVAVRFGNVLGSNGSVIPLFKEQIKEGGPVTVTHPDVIRYFMTIPEAVSLVLTAGALAWGGEIFVLDMGEPVKIKDLAENLIRLSGFKPNKDIEIVYTGLRPGEKLFEELLLSDEGIKKTESKKIYIGKPIDLDYSRFISELDELYLCAKSNNRQDIEQMLKQMVPTFKHSLNNKSKQDIENNSKELQLVK